MINSYKIVKLIKNNSKFARVFLVKKNNQLFVLKEFFFKKGGKELFTIEASINYDFAPKLIETFIYNNKGVVVRNFIEHKNLNQYCKQNIFIKKSKYFYHCIDMFIKILHKLSELHKKNIIHNDLKPSNILIEKETENIFFIDFAMAKLPSISRKKLVYSLIYSPPEHIFKFYDLYTFDTDLYILALSFWSALNNQRTPFYYPNPEILINIQLNLPLPRGELDKDLYTILNTAAYKTPLPKPPTFLDKKYIYNHILQDKKHRFDSTLKFIKKLSKYKETIF